MLAASDTARIGFLIGALRFPRLNPNLYLRHTVEVDGHAKPAAVVETITRCIF